MHKNWIFLHLETPDHQLPLTARVLKYTVRNSVAIEGCSGMVCHMYDDGLQPCWIKLLQLRSPDQCLVCRDGAGNTLDEY